MAKHLAPYRTYVIRCWKEQSALANPGICRFSLEIPGTGERFGFARSEELIHALELALSQIQAQAMSDANLEDEPD